MKYPQWFGKSQGNRVKSIDLEIGETWDAQIQILPGPLAIPLSEVPEGTRSKEDKSRPVRFALDCCFGFKA